MAESPNFDWQPRLRENLARVRAAIVAACARAGRNPEDVHLVGVTKYVPVEVLRALLAAGVSDVGENHIQQLAARAQQCSPARFDWPETSDAAAAGPRWHMLGHVQRNKVKLLLPYARIVHSLDSVRLAHALDEQAQRLAVRVDVFIEVNVTGEASKTGAAPETLPEIARALSACPRLCLRGLMTLTPYDPDPEAARPHFRRLRALRDELRSGALAAPACTHLSMGMSQDYPVAIEEGATFVRVGSALFAGLPTTDPRES
jgi:PLP dependent protein